MLNMTCLKKLLQLMSRHHMLLHEFLSQDVQSHVGVDG